MALLRSRRVVCGHAPIREWYAVLHASETDTTPWRIGKLHPRQATGGAPVAAVTAPVSTARLAAAAALAAVAAVGATFDLHRRLHPIWRYNPGCCK